jgi:DNA-binding transcriptional regulator YiaG
MSFTNADFKKLRQRLGWSRPEMARRLGCDVESVGAWESGSSRPDKNTLNEIRNLNQQADACSDQTAHRPLLEKELEDRRATQITPRDLT